MEKRRDARILGEHIPSERTISGYLKRVKALDTSDPWTWDERASAVLPVLAELIHQRGGGSVRVSQAGAEWIYRLRAVYPDLDPLVISRLGPALVKAQSKGVEWGAVHEFVALTPWRDNGASLRLYFRSSVEQLRRRWRLDDYWAFLDIAQGYPDRTLAGAIAAAVEREVADEAAEAEWERDHPEEAAAERERREREIEEYETEQEETAE
jgi:hypothetical protein